MREAIAKDYHNACEQKYSNLKYNSNFENYSNKGFALIYDENLYKNKIINKKIDERSLVVLNNKLKFDTPVKITNLLNGKYILAKIGKKSKYPFFYNSVISKSIAEDFHDVDRGLAWVCSMSAPGKSTYLLPQG